MGNKKNRNPEKKERKRIEKEQGVGLPVQADVEEEIRKKFDDGFEHITNARYDKGIEIFTEALELISKFMKNTSSYAKNCATAYNYRGMAYYRNGEHDKALKDYNEAIRNNSNYADAYNNRGNVYSYKTKYDLAIKDYNETIKLDPNHAEAYNNIGSFYHNKNEYDLAIKNYNEAIRDC